MDEFIGLLLHLVSDEQDSIRLLCVDNCIAVGKISKDKCEQYLIPVIESLCKDSSWKVRYVIANNIAEITQSFFGEQIPEEFVKNTICVLLKDSIPEVKCTAIPLLSTIAQHISPEVIIKLIIPLIGRMCNENESPPVRAALASHITSLSPILGPDNSITHLVDYVIFLLKDESSEVRLNLVQNQKLMNIIGTEQLIQKLLSAIIQLTDDPQWRIRKSMIEYFPYIGKILGVTYFNEKLNHINISKITDTVCMIRETAIKNLEAISKNFGTDWINQHIIPHVQEFIGSKQYIIRLSALHIFNRITDNVEPELIINVILPNTLKLVNDPVPNIRLNVAITLVKIYTTISSNENQIKSALELLVTDKDKDVRYNATQALKIVA